MIFNDKNIVQMYLGPYPISHLWVNDELIWENQNHYVNVDYVEKDYVIIKTELEFTNTHYELIT